ncbi:MAG: hypothetical protein OXH06_17550 [Gemmatimonadetes bacterium]|nr:hypothetical protein [Gemmatimonadota bacterium]
MKNVLKLQSSLLLCVVLSGCATYTHNAVTFRSSLAGGHYETALQTLGSARKGPARLLYLMENGLISHYRGEYHASNRFFESAERLSDRLFTRSLSREVASLITNDQVRAYRGEEFELAFINYYRALNYWYLNEPEEALVECRKANLKLDRYAAQADYDATYRNDAFIHYITGLIYEATGELNDAYVSYRNALDAYETYHEAFGLAAPETLARDLKRVEAALDFVDNPGEAVATRDSNLAGDGELIVFSEIGFVPHKVEEEISLPIYEGDDFGGKKDRLEAVSRKIAYRHFKPHYAGKSKVKYWLRVALPAYKDVVPRTRTIRVSAAGRQTATTLAEDLSSIAWQTFQDKQPTILARTVARGLVKYSASVKAKEKSKVLGFIVNLFSAAIETADTRSWVSLPHNVQIGRLALPAGTHTLTLESLDNRGRVIETGTISDIDIRPGTRTFVNYRTYK